MSLTSTDVVILCGGLGTRLRERVGETQKTMAQVDGRPFLDIILKYLAHHDFRRVILCTGYQAAAVEARYGRRAFGLQVALSREEEPLGTGGAVRHARELIVSDPFFVLNGDSFCALDYPEFGAFHKARGAQVTIGVSRVREASDYGSIALDKDRRITRFHEKALPAGSGGGYVNAGIYCFNREVFAWMPGEAFSLERDFFPQILEKNVFGFDVGEPFVDIGTPERFEEAQETLRRRK